MRLLLLNLLFIIPATLGARDSRQVGSSIKTQPAIYELIVRPSSIASIIAGGPAKNFYVYRKRIDSGGATKPVANTDPLLEISYKHEDVIQISRVAATGFGLKVSEPGDYVIHLSYGQGNEVLHAELAVHAVLSTTKLEAAVIEIDLLTGYTFDLGCIPVIAHNSDGTSARVSDDLIWVLREGVGVISLHNSLVGGVKRGKAVVQGMYGGKSVFIRVNGVKDEDKSRLPKGIEAVGPLRSAASSFTLVALSKFDLDCLPIFASSSELAASSAMAEEDASAKASAALAKDKDVTRRVHWELWDGAGLVELVKGSVLKGLVAKEGKGEVRARYKGEEVGVSFKVVLHVP
mmetsp:Transcript_23658/g.51908  ORF Transcript_23658/g.51908 Transcript_23658/m.51908 type:complete len:347 (-) Transcript_23658:249-1289(-)|eukprot:CAMPEP_0202894418 /NCGR_PEP_ID=MMETSP1392-20130828/3833_1 /ASSEMBLY_ACC=CAM_ASM_000868 /TAXON_ID=225041 /ORGANISM="Chlamydomonas chlamydogama, Strain SAG 11-48b" /LENGTH=346 /DNA_ID=CAMNT_0049579117 /DNA_START=131 /DNA_END=1171 /DNA_ORIENTATION=-